MKKITGLGFMLLMFSLSAQTTEKAHQYYDSFFAFFKGTNTEITNKVLTKYIQDTNYEVYKKYNKDEFEWNDKLETYKKELTEKIAAYNSKTNLTVVTGMEFANYDFENLGFPVSINPNIFFPIKSENYLYSSMQKIALLLKDFSKFNFIYMDKDSANVFVKSRKSTNGNINRNITLLIHFNFMDFTTTEYSNITATIDKDDYYPVVAIIKTIDVYDNNTKIGELVIK